MKQTMIVTDTDGLRIVTNPLFAGRKVEIEPYEDELYIRLHVEENWADTEDAVVYGNALEDFLKAVTIAEYMLKHEKKPFWAEPAFNMPVL